MSRRHVIGIIITVAVILTAIVSVVVLLKQRPNENPKRPNIVFILTDDQSMDLTKFTPKTNKLIGDEGAFFSNYIDNISLCCAARVSIMRGQYAHNTKVEDNELPNGGFGKFYQLGEQNDNVATWLKDAGYNTSLMGKYLNGYPSSKRHSEVAVSDTYVPPGWSDWFSPVDGNPYSQYNYTMNENGSLKKYGRQPDDYMVDVISDRASRYITDHKDSSKPYFMYVAPYSPHAPYTPAPRYKGTESALEYPTDQSFNEQDISDKPSSIANQALLTDKSKNRINSVYQKRAESMKGVDDLVASIYDALKKTNQLDNTYIVFTSDNGYHMGEHRLGIGKYTPYETDIHLPLYVRGPGIQAGAKSKSLAGNIDLASTFAQIAGARVPDYVDGKSLLPLLKGEAWQRKYYLLERLPSSFMGTEDTDEASTEEPADPKLSDRTNTTPPPPYSGIRTSDGYTYVKYLNGEEEFYDLRTDPYQLDNLVSKNSVKKSNATQQTVYNELKRKLLELKACKSSKCFQ